jgi:hypothetical protein
MKSAHTKAKRSPVRDGGRKPDPKQVNQATSKEFEREGLGVAPKE